MDRQLIGGEDMFLWLSRGDLKGHTESEIKQQKNRHYKPHKYHATKILQTERDIKCSPCKQLDETVGHITSASPILTKEQ